MTMSKKQAEANAGTEMVISGSHDEPSVVTERQMVATASGATFKVARQVTVPTLKHHEGTVVIIQILEPMKETESRDETIDDKTGDVKRKSLWVIRVLNLNDGRIYDYVGNAVTVSRLQEQYPNGDYVGRYFEIYKGEKMPGTRAKAIEINELEPA